MYLYSLIIPYIGNIFLRLICTFPIVAMYRKLKFCAEIISRISPSNLNLFARIVCKKLIISR